MTEEEEDIEEEDNDEKIGVRKNCSSRNAKIPIGLNALLEL